MRGNEGERKQTSQKNRNTVEVSVNVFEENGMLHVFYFCGFCGPLMFTKRRRRGDSKENSMKLQTR